MSMSMESFVLAMSLTESLAIYVKPGTIIGNLLLTMRTVYSMIITKNIAPEFLNTPMLVMMRFLTAFVHVV